MPTPDAPIQWPAGLERTRSGRPLVGHPGPPPPSAIDTGVEALLAQFTAACVAVGGTVHRLTDAAAVAALVAKVCDEAGSRAVMAWDEAHLPLPGVYDALHAAGLTVVPSALEDEGETRDAALVSLDGASAGITGALALLADTGSLVVTSGSGRPRLASLLPPVHVALVSASQLVPSLGALLSHSPRLPLEAANVVAITGPSRTADIEMTLTRGVHGPKFLHVVFVS
jgi:L-lactate dehydrogenase complex protein LldG